MTRRKRVLVLNHFAAPRGEAGGTRHVELFGRLPNWEYLIIASDLNPQTGKRVRSEPGLAVVGVPAYSSNGPRRILNWVAYGWRAFLLGLRQPRVDVVYGSSPHLFAAAAAWLIAAVRRKPFVLEVRDLWPQVLIDMGTLKGNSPVFKMLTALEESLYARAVAIVVMAQGTVDALIVRGIPEEKLHYIPNGADPEDFLPSAPRDSLRARYGFDRFTALYAGAHGPANGLDLLLDAARDVRDLEVSIVLVGGGVLKEHLERRTKTEGLANVRFMDPVPKSEIPDLLAAADLGLHILADAPLFQSAVSPNKIFDYMAATLPVLTNCPGSVTSLIRDSKAGYACRPTEIAPALRDAMAQSAQLGILGANGRTWISEHQSRTKMATRLADALAVVKPA